MTPTRPARQEFPWRKVIITALQAATAAVRRIAPVAGRRVVAGRESGYRPWDPETIAVDTAAERAIIASLRQNGVHGSLLSEEAGAKTLLPGRARMLAPGPAYVVVDPFDGSMLYRRGFPAQWFTAIGIHGQDGRPIAAGVIDHLGGEITLADDLGAVRLTGPNGRPVRVRPSRCMQVAAACVETYLMRPTLLYATTKALRPLLEQAQFIFPNGGPGGFVDVACGRADVYVAWNEALTEVFSACFIAERAGCVLTQWDGSPVSFTADIRATYALVCSANRDLHDEVIRILKPVRVPRELQS